MIEKIKELQKKYKEVKELQYQLRKELRGKEIEISDENNSFIFDEYCSDFKIGLIDVADDCIEVLYMYEEDGEKEECIDFLEFNDFIKYVKLK